MDLTKVKCGNIKGYVATESWEDTILQRLILRDKAGKWINASVAREDVVKIVKGKPYYHVKHPSMVFYIKDKVFNSGTGIITAMDDNGLYYRIKSGGSGFTTEGNERPYTFSKIYFTRIEDEG